MQISKEQPMRTALDDVIDAVNGIGDIEPYITEATNDWLDAHPEATTTVQDNSLTTAKYQDNSLTTAKYQDGSVTTEKIADGAVTYDKLHEPDLLMVGGAESVTNDEAITREYLYEPVPDGVGDGLALIEAVYGNTIVQDGSLLPVRMEGVETVAADESWSSQRTIPAATYFPQGMRSAGTVCDELTETQAITRMGAVDLGTLTWIYKNFPSNPTRTLFYATAPNDIVPAISSEQAENIKCANYETVANNIAGIIDKTISYGAYWTLGKNLYVYDSAYGTDAAAFKQAMSGVMLHYALATPTVTPIDPPLALSYRVGSGGTERVMVADGTTSAPPIFATRYPLDPADLAESIAPRESTIATGNHAIGDLLMLGWTMCKATQVIVTGETIEIGTNVTRTSVAAEIAALS